MQFTKIETQLYATVDECIVSNDGTQITARYSFGTGVEKDGVLTDYQPVITDYKYINGEQAIELINYPINKDDIGKLPNDVMKERVYKYLKSINAIAI
jgi:hypothetical protein|nr:MAG TPA: hypothetical protein [Caudoviricetes sp.]DAP27136.1 MAG TPA: hypothetical protein [Caudoviricetes sp.]